MATFILAIPFVPHCFLVPSPPKFSTLLGFPGPNVLLIRAHPKPSSQCTRHCLYLSLPSSWDIETVSHGLVTIEVCAKSPLVLCHVPWNDRHIQIEGMTECSGGGRETYSHFMVHELVLLLTVSLNLPSLTGNLASPFVFTTSKNLVFYNLN